MERNEIGGVLPVLYSFFDDAGNLRPDGYRHQAAHAMENGARGVVLFGFVTQFYRLAFREKIDAIRATRDALGGRGSLGVTVMEPTPQGQRELVRAAESEGADWIILQPPLGPPVRSADWMDMLRALIDGATAPVAVQNASIANARLSNAELAALQADCPNLVAVKAETSTAEIVAFARQYGTSFRTITGDWGAEYPLYLRHGAHGLIPAPNFVPEQAALHAAGEAEDWDRVDALHARVLPLLQFLRDREGIEAQMLLGKHAYCWRTGYDPGVNRAPGPQSLDPAVMTHARRLTETLTGETARS